MMNQVIKTRWVKALRSGRYTQTTCVLDSPQINGTVHHCCLGVLQRICKLPERVGDEVHSELLSKAALNAAGITKKQQARLTAMNDGNAIAGEDGQTFKEIADYIEAKL